MEDQGILKKWGLVSWEPEILISAGLILSLYNVQPLLVLFYNIVSPHEIEGFAIAMAFFSGTAGVLAVGFTLHLALRAYWLMKMGVAYAFNNKLDAESFNARPIYQKRLDRIDLFKNAIIIGKLSSLFFGINFFLLLISLGIVTTLLFGLVLSYFLDFSGYLFFFLLLLVFIDFISLGRLKRTKIGSLLYPVFAFFNVLTLSFLYRDIYYSLISNVKWYKLFIGLIFIFLCFIGLAVMNSHKILRIPNPILIEGDFPNYNPKLYDDERGEYVPTFISISSYYQEREIMKLFVLRSTFHRVALDRKAVNIKIDGNPIEIEVIRDYRTNEYQSGYLFFIDLGQIQRGKEHLLSFNIEKEKMPEEFYVGGYPFKQEIPFYKE